VAHGHLGVDCGLVLRVCLGLCVLRLGLLLGVVCATNLAPQVAQSSADGCLDRIRVDGFHILDARFNPVLDRVSSVVDGL